MYLFLLFVSVLANSLCLDDYYWKDYAGKIPDDAVPGGHDVNGDNTYIGLVYLSDAGVFPTTIRQGDKVVYACAHTNTKSGNYIQILCSANPKNIRWIPANKTDFHLLTINKHLIRGGVQNGNWLHIGRFNHQGEVIIGKILSGRAGLQDAEMRYVHDDSTRCKVANSYEILIFDKLVPKKNAKVIYAFEGDMAF